MPQRLLKCFNTTNFLCIAFIISQLCIFCHTAIPHSCWMLGFTLIKSITIQSKRNNIDMIIFIKFIPVTKECNNIIVYIIQVNIIMRECSFTSLLVVTNQSGTNFNVDRNALSVYYTFLESYIY